jgi:flagellum-specific ATP synthase
MPSVTGPKHREKAAMARRLMATHQRSADLVRIGAYKVGMDVELDRAIAALPKLRAFMQQGVEEGVEYSQTIAALQAMEI